MPSHIYVVATPLGNREDLSPRAKRILQEADLIACEDTRRTGQLLESLGISHSTLISYYDANEEKRAEELVERVHNSQLKLALVSDAGTPAIADPGFRLIKRAHEMKIPISPIPGPSTLTSLVSVSGLASDRVLFVGFLPRKKQDLIKAVHQWKKSQASVVAFESPNRLCESLEVLSNEIPKARICIGRELTKIYEEIHLFTMPEARKWAEEHTHLKGELALMIESFAEEDSVEEDWEPFLKKAKFLLSRNVSTKDIVECFADSVPDKKEFYRRVLSLQDR